MSEDRTHQAVALLRASSLFASLGEEELSGLSDCVEVMECRRGETIFRAGDPGDALFLLMEGEVAVSKEVEEGRSITLATFIQGDCFGELDFFARSRRDATAAAEKDSLLLVFPRRSMPFDDLMKRRPKLFAKVLHAFLATVAHRIRATNRLIKENAPWVKELKHQILTDAQTGLFTRAYLEEEYPAFCSEPTALIMLKPDNFKQLNDSYGHSAGDGAMKLLAAMLRSVIGPELIGVRYRGNELAVVLPATEEQDARAVAERLCEAVKALDLGALTGGAEFRFTASLSVVTHRRQDGDWLKAVSAAYELLYRARSDGGDRCYASHGVRP